MLPWFNGLTRKEQLLLLLCSFCIVMYFVFFIVLRPMYISASDLERQNKVAAESLKNIKILASEFKLLTDSGTATSASPKQNLTLIIDKLVKDNDLQMKRFQPPSTGDVQLRFENSAFNKILNLINQLESTYSVRVKDLSVSQGGIEGTVDVSIRLHSAT